jgi:hypothetical protein
MRKAATLALFVSLLAVSPADAQKNSNQSKPIELTGCVSGQPTAAGTYTLTDSQGGKYRLTGKKMQKYAGRMVAVVSGSSKRVTVSGGLWPSPNAAGQAGALDPAQESIARQRGGSTRPAGEGAELLPEFNVIRVRTVEGACQ